MSILEILIEKKIISTQIAQMMEKYSTEWGFSLFDTVLRCNILSENDLLELLSQELSLTHLYSIENSDLKENFCESIDFRDACNFICFNLGLVDSSYKILVNNPLDPELIGFLDTQFDSYEMYIAEKQLILDTAIKFYEVTEKIPTYNRIDDD